MGRIRTFVAVDISNKIRDAAMRQIAKFSALTNDYNWVVRENMHVTLNFLGDVDESEIPSVCRLISNTSNEFGSFEMSVKGTGCFPRPDKPRIIWLGIDQGAEELIELQRRLADALETMRFPRDRNDFRPHLTLGRLQRGARLSDRVIDAVSQGVHVTAGSTIVDQVVVYSSFLDREGPTYTAMSRIDLV